MNDKSFLTLSPFRAKKGSLALQSVRKQYKKQRQKEKAYSRQRNGGRWLSTLQGCRKSLTREH